MKCPNCEKEMETLYFGTNKKNSFEGYHCHNCHDSWIKT